MAEGLIEKIKALGAINDSMYTDLFVQGHPHWGIKRIKDVLSQKGISEDIIEKAFDKADLQSKEIEKAVNLAGQWFRSGMGQRRIVGRLSRRGFSYEVTSSAMEILEEEEKELDDSIPR